MERFLNIGLRWCFCFLLLSGSICSSAETAKTWKCGWYSWPPYNYEVTKGEITVLTGLDVQLIRAIGQAAEREVEYSPVGWAQHQEDLKTGRRDIAGGATWTPERDKLFYFSDPYRTEQNVLYLRSPDAKRFNFANTTEMLEAVRSGKMRLGVLLGFAYASPEVRAFISDPANAGHLSFAMLDADNLVALVDKRIDGFLVDRLVAATLVLESKYAPEVSESKLQLGSVDIHVMFSKVTQNKEDVAQFNAGLQQLQKTGDFDRILRHYLLPPILNITVGARWFYWLDLVAIAAFAVSGVLLAQKERYNLVGALLLATLPSVGGGTLRDLITDRHPVTILRRPEYLILVIVVVVIGFVLFKLLERSPSGISPKVTRGLDWVYKTCDTLGLALLTVAGVRIAVETRCEPLWLWGPLLAALTGAGGGILRDIVRSDQHNQTLKDGFFAEVALVWGFVYSLFVQWQSERPNLEVIYYGTVFVLIGAFGMRMCALWFHWKNPFRFGSRANSPVQRLTRIQQAALECGHSLSLWLEERDEFTNVRPLPDLEKLHSDTLDRLDEATWELQEIAHQPLPMDLARRASDLEHLLGSFRSLDLALYDLGSFSSHYGCGVLCKTMFSSLGLLLEELAELPVGPSEAASQLIRMTSDGGPAMESLRKRFAPGATELPESEISRDLQFTVKFEHVVRLISQYATLISRPTLATELIG